MKLLLSIAPLGTSQVYVEYLGSVMLCFSYHRENDGSNHCCSFLPAECERSRISEDSDSRTVSYLLLVHLVSSWIAGPDS